MGPRVAHEAYPEQEEEEYRAIKGLEGLRSPDMGTKVLPWLSSVERGVPPDEAASRPASLIGILKDTRTSGARSTGTAAVISPRYDTAPMQPAREDAFSSSTVMKLVAEQPVPAYADDSSIGDALDRQLHAGSGTDVSRGGRGMTPVSGTIPSAFYLQMAPTSPVSISHLKQRNLPGSATGPISQRIVSSSSFGNVNRSVDPREGRRQTQPISRGRSPSKPVGPMGDQTDERQLHDVSRQLHDVSRERENSSTRTAIPSANPPPQPVSTASSAPEPHFGSEKFLYTSPDHPSAAVLVTPALALREPQAPAGELRSNLMRDDVLCHLVETVGRSDVGHEVKRVLQQAIEKRVKELQGGHGTKGSLARQDDGDETPSWAAKLFHAIETNTQRLDAIQVQLDERPRTRHAAHQSLAQSQIDHEDAQRILEKMLADSLDQSHASLGLVLGDVFGASPYRSHDASHFHPVAPPRHHQQQHGRLEEILSDPLDDPRMPLSPLRSAAGFQAPPEINVQPPSTSGNLSRPKGSSSKPPAPYLPEFAYLEEENRQREAEQARRSSTPAVVSKDFASSSPALDKTLPPTPKQSPSSRGSVFAFKPPPVSDDGLRRDASARDKPPSVTSDVPEDPLLPIMPRPWDQVTQMLYSWALIWYSEDLQRTLEAISVGRQVNALALTIWTTVTFKRQLRNKLSDDPRAAIDKMFIPPSSADLLNQLCKRKQYGDARAVLEQLWYPLGLDSLSPSGSPRVIVALCRHRNEDDTWAAHRFDLSSSCLTSYLFYAVAPGEEEVRRKLDGRPALWWNAIRAAWPSAGVKHPDHMAPSVLTAVIVDQPQSPNPTFNASLAAVNCFRNLLLGWRWDHLTDLTRLRELIWIEVKRLLQRKTEGKLTLEANPLADV